MLPVQINPNLPLTELDALEKDFCANKRPVLEKIKQIEDTWGKEALLAATLGGKQRRLFARCFSEFIQQSTMTPNEKMYVQKLYTDFYTLIDRKDEFLRMYERAAKKGVLTYPHTHVAVHFENYRTVNELKLSYNNYLNLLQELVVDGVAKKTLQQHFQSGLHPGDACLEARSAALQNYLLDTDCLLDFDSNRNLYQNVSEALRVYRNQTAKQFAKEHPDRYPNPNFSSDSWRGMGGMRLKIHDDEEYEKEYGGVEKLRAFLLTEDYLGRRCMILGKMDTITEAHLDRIVGVLDKDGLI